MSHERLDPKLSALEAALASLKPVETQVDRDRLMYQAGAAAANDSSQTNWLWPLATAAMAVVSITLGTILLSGPRGSVAERRESESPSDELKAPTDEPVGDEAIDSNTSSALAAGSDPHYLRLRQLVLTRGVDVLPDGTSEQPSSNPPMRRRQMLDELLGT